MGPLWGLFPRLFRISINKEAHDSDCFEVRNSCTLWIITFKRRLQPLDGESYELLSFFK